MTVNELKVKRGQLGSEAQRLLTTPNRTAAQKAEDRTKAAAMLDEADGITAEIELLERSYRLNEQTGRMENAPRPNPGEDRDAATGGIDLAAKRYRVAFEMYMRFGEKGVSGEDRIALSAGSRTQPARTIMVAGEKRDITEAATGNYIVPQEFYSELISGKKFIGGITKNVRRKTTPGNGAPMKIGFENDTANTIVVVAENTTVTEADPTLSGIVSSTDTLATLIKVSKQELADSGFDLNALFRNRLGIRYARGLENFIVNGDTANIQALLTVITGGVSGTNFNITAANTGPAYADFVACETLLDPIYEQGAKWYMHKKTRNYVMGLLDTLNRPLFLPNPQTGMLDEILGYPIVLSAYLPAANAPSANGVLFGDLEEGYLLRDDGEMTIQRLDERYADQLMVGFLAYTRVGGNATDPGTHPVVGMQTHV